MSRASRALSLACLLALGGCGGDALRLPPEITAQPVASTVARCGPATFTVVAAGTPPLRYQWLKDGQPIPGSTSATLQIGVSLPESAGDYAVLVTNDLGSVSTGAVALTVVEPGPPPEPTALVLEDAGGLAFAGGRIFWGDGIRLRTTLEACPGKAETAFYAYGVVPGPLLEIAGDLYWMDSNAGGRGVFRTAPSTLETVRIVENAGQPSAFLEWGGQLVWTDRPNAMVLTTPLSGGVPTAISLQTGAPMDEICGLATDGTSYYWTGWSGVSWPVVNTMALSRTPVGGGPSFLLAADQGGVCSVVTDGARVYWSGTTGTSPDLTAYVRSIDVAGQGPVVELSSRLQSQGAAVVLDGDSLYWGTRPIVVPGATLGSGALQVIPEDDSQAPTVLYTSEVGPAVIIPRGAYIFWSESSTPSLPGRGRIMRMGR